MQAATLLQAQNRLTDSLYTIVRNSATGNKERIRALSSLARVVRHQDTGKALALAEQAVLLAQMEKDAAGSVYAYESRASVYLSRREMEKAHQNSDSCLWFAGQTGDARAKGWAWYGKGRELNFENKGKEALEALLKALQFIKGQQDWQLEASIYYALYGVFSTWEDVAKTEEYAKLALDAAQKSGNPNNLCESWQAMASALHERYLKTGEKDRALLEECLTSYRNAVDIYRQHEGNMEMLQLITIPCINIADAYNRHFPASKLTTDSLRHYASLAFEYATKGKDKRLQAASLGLMNEDAKRNGDYQLAETYLTQALTLFTGDPAPDYYIRFNVYRDLAELAERRKDPVSALSYYKSYLDDYRKVYDMEQSEAGRQLEARYQAREKEQEIKFLKERQTMHERERYLYVGIGIALLGGLIFMFRSYHFRLRFSLQREQLLQKENASTRLQAQLKEEENLLLEKEKQNAELHARLQEEQAKLKTEEAARLQTEQEMILTQKEVLHKEVLAGRLQVEQKNKILNSLKERLLDGRDIEIKRNELNKLLSREARIDHDFEEVKTGLRDIHPDFYRRLQEKAGNKLTELDMKHCAYILLNRNNKEMAMLLSVEPKSIRMSKYRLKQKLGLAKEDDMEEYIRNLA